MQKKFRESCKLIPGNKVEFVLNSQGEIVFKPVIRKNSEMAGMLSQYKKSAPVSIEAMNQAVKRRFRPETI